MQVRKGYKQTEVGVIPEEWDVGNLGLFWGVTDCKHVTATFVQNGIPLASIKEVQSRFIDLANAKKTTEQYYSQLIEGGRKPLPGDLIISRNATVGETSQVAEWHPRFAMGQDVCLLRKKSSEHSTDYLQSVFQSPIIANQLTNLMVGSTFKRVNVEQIRNFVVPMPLPDEQRAIATALSDVDALLASQEKLIAKKRDIKQAAMQQLLSGKQRLPGFSGEWAQKTIASICEYVGGVMSQGGEEGYIEIGDIDVVLKDYDISDKEKLSVPGSVRVPSGTLLISKVRPTRGAIAVAREDIFVSSAFCRLRPLNAFLFHLVCQDRFLAYLGENSIGGTYPTCKEEVILRYTCLMPSAIEEQVAIAEILSDMDADLAALERQRDKTRALKQGMMQELLTGRIRLV